MTFWMFVRKDHRWRMRRRYNLDINERKYGLESLGRYNRLKEFYFRLARRTANARYFAIFLAYPVVKYYRSLPKDDSAAKRAAKEMEDADTYVRTQIPVDPVLGNPEISADKIGALISSNYGFESMIELISLNKKSNEFWEYMCWKIDTETDGEKWHDYID